MQISIRISTGSLSIHLFPELPEQRSLLGSLEHLAIFATLPEARRQEPYLINRGVWKR
jgi:hypothetical protein